MQPGWQLCHGIASEGPKGDLPYNIPQAEDQLRGIVKRFKADENYHAEYRKFTPMEQGHAERAPPRSQTGSCGISRISA